MGSDAETGLERLTPQTLAILRVLRTDRARDWYGFDLAAAAGIRTGTVYAVLARLERLGWLESWWEEVHSRAGRPRRRFYRLTEEGTRGATDALERADARVSRAPNAQVLRPQLGGASS
jgi:PadR family transcriptional regulator